MSKKNKFHIERARLNAAMEEFLANGGKIKKVKKTRLSETTNHYELDDDLFADYSSHDISCNISFNRGSRFGN